VNRADVPLPKRRGRMLDFGGGGWVLLLAGVLALPIFIWQLLPIVSSSGQRAIGDGSHVATYGFDLSTCRVPRHLIVAAGLPKDGLPAMTDPPTIAAAEVSEGARLAGVRKLLPTDRVVGLEFGGQARAYPLWVLAWHEVVNDTVGGRPIVATYSGLCDSVAVFDRSVAGEILEFGVSGLLFNSNLLMYDRRPDAIGESLWSQLQFRAISGPAAEAGAVLELLPSAVLAWGQWRERYPQTTVVLPDPRRAKLYRRDAYLPYYGGEKLRFPVEPLPPADTPALMTPMVAWRCRATSSEDSLSAVDLPWRVLRRDEFELPADWQRCEIVYALRFAWHAANPDQNSPQQRTATSSPFCQPGDERGDVTRSAASSP